MADDIEQRLVAGAQSVREFGVAGQRCSDLRGRLDELSTQLESLRSQYAGRWHARQLRCAPATGRGGG